MQSKSPQEQRRLIFLLAGLSDVAISIFFLLVAVRIIPIFTDTESWIFLLIAGAFFLTGSFVTIFNLTPKDHE